MAYGNSVRKLGRRMRACLEKIKILRSSWLVASLLESRKVGFSSFRFLGYFRIWKKTGLFGGASDFG
uniref:Uncharacterized protein n=1 Tax=Oryza sativa subsp. japonica TaxID=39947 RepID=Q10GZ4_ORYSJ|nr:hypothetical protein LOC_Os03g41154 [Oryza sativa Japonica Group]